MHFRFNAGHTVDERDEEGGGTRDGHEFFPYTTVLGLAGAFVRTHIYSERI